ncbi:hypothetical protein QF026_003830 [Streptomyces aurantiacus]|jgi:hypothetical protein|uniref:hypothetical protein n=1 Tax=Streptomyces aurantiacus TaxID=47760 RepID=UPI00279376B7|nr:hypothetical protein [Streptomyces aurantiacus]MDQ0775364.1 hypothetical protein [Streptomyces aurantiacus]
MGGDGRWLKWMWVAIILIGALVCGCIAAGIFWLATSAGPAGGRVKVALAAGGVTFLGLATLGIAIGSFVAD